MLKKVKNRKSGLVEWALVSRADPSRVLKYFGERKPTDAQLHREESRVNKYKHRGTKVATNE